MVLILVTALAAVPAFAGPVPSKTAANQSLDQRTADIAVVRDVLSHDEVAKALEARGFTRAEVDQKLAQLSPQDLHQLAQNLDQIQAAGLTRQEWYWIGIGAVAVLILIIAPTAAIGHHNKDHEIPTNSPTGLAHKLKHALTTIQTGHAPDPHNWLLHI